jgi:hypothetical protein
MQVLGEHDKSEVCKRGALMFITKSSLQVLNVSYKDVAMPLSDGDSEKICAARQPVTAVVGHNVSSEMWWVRS